MAPENLHPISQSRQNWKTGIVWCSGCGKDETSINTVKLFVLKMDVSADNSRAVFYCQECATYIAKVLTDAWKETNQ
jgi:hypothetical protein